MQNLMHVREV